ncbi:MAG: hypothetical protein AAF958_12760 [Planctomycetota bacterium]
MGRERGRFTIPGSPAVWDSHFEKVRFSIEADRADLVTYSDKRDILAASSGRSVSVWQAKDGAKVFQAEAGGLIRSLSFSADGTRLAVAGAPALVELFDTASGRQVFRTEGTCAAFHPTRGLMVGTEHGQLLRLDSTDADRPAATSLTSWMERNRGLFDLLNRSPFEHIAVSVLSDCRQLAAQHGEESLCRVTFGLCLLRAKRVDELISLLNVKAESMLTPDEVALLVIANYRKEDPVTARRLWAKLEPEDLQNLSPKIRSEAMAMIDFQALQDEAGETGKAFRQRLVKCLEKVNRYREGQVLFGRVVAENIKDPWDVAAQMEILPGGYFVTAVGPSDRPFSFQRMGHDTAIIYPRHGEGLLHCVGDVYLPKTKSSQMATLTGKVSNPKLTELVIAPLVRKNTRAMEPNQGHGGQRESLCHSPNQGHFLPSFRPGLTVSLVSRSALPMRIGESRWQTGSFSTSRTMSSIKYVLFSPRNARLAK